MTYSNPLRDVQHLRAERIDQGVDYAGSGPIYPVGPCRILVNEHNPGWPGGSFMSYVLLDGPAQGKAVYLAENVTRSPIPVGARVNPDTTLGILHDAFPNCETGWARWDGRGPLSQSFPPNGDGSRNNTKAGHNFDSFMQVMGAPPGIPEGDHVVRGGLPAGWPEHWARLLTTPPYPGHPLKLGVQRPAVLVWKARLFRLGYRGFLLHTQHFGHGTEKATRALQTERQLTVDGIVGPRTWDAGWAAP